VSTGAPYTQAVYDLQQLASGEVPAGVPGGGGPGATWLTDLPAQVAQFTAADQAAVTMYPAYQVLLAQQAAIAAQNWATGGYDSTALKNAAIATLALVQQLMAAPAAAPAQAPSNIPQNQGGLTIPGSSGATSTSGGYVSSGRYGTYLPGGGVAPVGPAPIVPAIGPGPTTAPSPAPATSAPAAPAAPTAIVPVTVNPTPIVVAPPATPTVASVAGQNLSLGTVVAIGIGVAALGALAVYLWRPEWILGFFGAAEEPRRNPTRRKRKKKRTKAARAK